ncbi:hypothetical protein, partial [Candidatus Sororendozoicomonas aggregata]|uniref:hypothetical protein n=1 Tax=Candidatus Sororendozoicomonas aggregata TaxID=3073239 RepID=UPI002ED2AD90
SNSPTIILRSRNFYPQFLVILATGAILGQAPSGTGANGKEIERFNQRVRNHCYTTEGVVKNGKATMGIHW